MQQPHSYAHRVKAAILARVAQRYPQDEMLFIHSDTFFTTLPDKLLQRLAGGTTFLHKREHTLAEAVGIYAATQKAQLHQEQLAWLLTEQARRTLKKRPA